MQRRNFVLGFGAVATLSGAASVTGATLTNEAEFAGDFRVIVDAENLVVRSNDGFDEEETDSENLDGDDLDFSELTEDDTPAATAEGEVDDRATEDLDVRTAIAESDGAVTFGDSSGTGILEIENQGDTEQTVGIRVADDGYGDDVGETGSITEGDVDELYDFVADDTGTDIGLEETEFIDIEPEDTVQVEISADASAVADIAAEADGSDDPFDDDGDASNLDLVDTLEVGVEDTT